MVRVVTETMIPLGKMVMVIMRSLVAVTLWHSHPPLHNIHTVVHRTPRSYNETSSSSLWTRIRRYRLPIPLDRGQMGPRYLRVLQAS